MHIDKEPRRCQCVENEIPLFIAQGRKPRVFFHRKTQLLQKELPQTFGLLDIVETLPLLLARRLGLNSLKVVRATAFNFSVEIARQAWHLG